MDIWEILNIEPTNDRRVIKKAYAAQSKIIHPEEKPEEFSILHEAYKAALEYAKGEKKPEEKTEENEREKNDEDSEGLLRYFEENIRNKEKNLAYFEKHWKEANWSLMDLDAKKWWEEYMASEEFREIQWHPQVIHSFVEHIEKKFPYWCEIRIFLCELYGFEKEDGSKYEGDTYKLWNILHQSYEEQKKDEEWKKEHQRIKELYEEKNKEQEQKEKKRKQYYKWIIPAAVIFICSLVSVLIYNNKKSKENYVVLYMEEEYPEVKFTLMGKGKKEGYNVTSYQARSSTHPDFLVTIKIKNMNIDIGMGKIDRTYEVEEDYGTQLMDYYAGQYGIKCRKEIDEHMDYSEKGWFYVFYYSDIEDIDGFCDAITKMYQETKEISVLGPVGICKDNILYPEVMLDGGVGDFHLFEKQLYHPEIMNAKEIKENLREAYISYMFHFETWNLTLQQFIEYAPEYRKICDSLEKYDGYWYSVYFPEGESYDIYIPIYESYGDEIITVGGAYIYLQACGVKMYVYEDKTGFLIDDGREGEFFGYNKLVSLNELKIWEKIQTK